MVLEQLVKKVSIAEVVMDYDLSGEAVDRRILLKFLDCRDGDGNG